ncbi:transporter [Mucilaginibacter phyllosphaerae]|uniref:Transporter n=2 Tax=Mucilaginibacter phyllosphaerae TaxID=1812349 RepID=A0A4Y8A655_9SPHI|nr:transporter [Mucilaginibacter phyllosphaerae]
MALISGNLLLYGGRFCYCMVYFTLFITVMKNIKFLLLGLLFGIILVKSEVASWFRIQEMFRLQAFHMYGVIGSAISVAMIAILIIKRFHLKTIHQETIVIPQKKFHWGNVYGGLIFGVGWAITGACPGPLFAQIGSGFFVIVVTLLSAVAGTWVYGLLRQRLPH